LKSQQIVNADVLVLGGGAGLSAAIEAIEARKHGVRALQVFERVRKAVNDMVKDCQVTSGHFVQLGSQLLDLLPEALKGSFFELFRNNLIVKFF
jgi:hypothetical protein